MDFKDLKTLTAADIMTSESIISVGPKTPVRDLSSIFMENNISGAPVLDENSKIVGVVTMQDVARCEGIIDLKSVLELVFFNASKKIKSEVDKHINENYNDELFVNYIMSKNPITTKKDVKIEEVLKLLLDKKINRVFVEENEKIIGIITISDIMGLFYSRIKELGDF